MKPVKNLSSIGKLKWIELEKVYVIDESTKDIAYALCQCYGRMIEAEEQMNEKGMLYKNPSGKVEASPMINISNQMQTQIKKHYDVLNQYKKRTSVENSEPEEYEDSVIVSDDMGFGEIDFDG